MNPKTLILGLYVQDGRASLTGKYVKADGELEGEVFEDVGEPWALLAKAVDDGVTHLKAHQLFVLTNDKAIADTFTYPVSMSQDNQDRWAVARRLFLYQYVEFKQVAPDVISRTREIWQRDLSK